MKKNMRDGSLYFRQRDIIRPVSTAALIASVLVAWFTYSWIAYIIAGIVAPVALVLFFVAGSRTISDSDMAEQIEHTMRDYDQPITDRNDFDRVVLKQPAPVETAAYAFGDQATFFKKGKNGTPVSDRYTGAHFFFTKDALMIVGRHISVTELGEEGAGIRDFSEIIAYADIRSATMTENTTSVKLTSTGKKLSVKWYELVVTAADGSEILRLPVRNDMEVSDLCEQINRRAL